MSWSASETSCQTVYRILTYPDSVSLVRPPKTTIPKTLTALPSNQYATVLSLTPGKLDFDVSDFAPFTAAESEAHRANAFLALLFRDAALMLPVLRAKGTEGVRGVVLVP